MTDAPKHEAPRGKPENEGKPEEATQQGKHEHLHERIKRAMETTHNTSRDVEVEEVHTVAPGLHVARIAHTPAAGARRHEEALVFDKDDKASLWFK